MAALMRYEDGFWPSLLAIGYAVGGWACGIACLLSAHPPLEVAGVVLVAHALVTSAYVIHESAHGAMFRSAPANEAAGILMTWINGACIARFDRLRHKHLRHHVDRADVVSFDYRAWLARRPRFVSRVVVALEWAHVPAVEFIMRGSVVASAFAPGAPRGAGPRMIAVLACRLALVAALASVSLRAALLYGLAYLLFIHVLRFLDAFQHTYEVVELPAGAERIPPAARRTRDYEHANTYSNLLTDSRLANLLVLNFAFHNAHHARPAVPWYRLPRLHAELYGPTETQVLPFRGLLLAYHRHRVARVLSPDYGEVRTAEPRVAGFLGAVGVSFLTAI